MIGTIERRMAQRNQKIEEIKQKMNTVEDRVYADFCKKIGVANIRQFEERELVLQQERAKMQADFDQQIDRITSRLDFERTKDTQGMVALAFVLNEAIEIVCFIFLVFEFKKKREKKLKKETL